MVYLDNAAFGMGAFDCTSLAHETSSDTPIYAGSKAGADTTATTAKALDLSLLAGNYKGRYTARLQLVKDFKVTGSMTYLDVNYYYFAADNAAQTAAKRWAKFRILKSDLDGAKHTPLEFSLPAVTGAESRYVRLELSSDAKTVTQGAILATIEPTRM